MQLLPYLYLQKSTIGLGNLMLNARESSCAVSTPRLPGILGPVCCEEDIMWPGEGHETCQSRWIVLNATGLRIMLCCLLREDACEDTDSNITAWCLHLSHDTGHAKTFVDYR